MKVLSFYISISIYLLFINNSCTYTTKQDSEPEPGKQEIARIIPKYKNGAYYYPSEMVQKYAKRIGLISLDKGYDSLFIRLWYVYSATNQVIDLKRSDGKWSAGFHLMKKGTIEERLDVIETNSLYISPKSDWNIFMNKLFSLNLLELSDEIEVPDYKSSVTDAVFVTVEIATKERYKIYSYTEPYTHLQFQQAANMENIMKTIEEEFGIKRSEQF